ncbi:SIR2 family protein [uncultured Algibacter sp.]|uniref:SIR2 family protein n=1 Tax=uncultured Algibacter sp. TaxID=298659 RepID=UPI002603E729|nr:SIR2 family protein [uncultured Algibacter sp.]
MEEISINELSEVIQSSKINFLIGSGVSRPFLPVLNNIEKNLNDATTLAEKEVFYKEYLKDVMLPNKKVVENKLDKDADFQKTKASYQSFCQTLCSTLLKRKTSILPKQANIFSTNIDVLIETVLESLQFDYNDGFSGRFTPVFGLENFKKSINQRSLHFDHISEIPVFNIIKMHGSITWKYNKLKDKILLSPNLDHIDDTLIIKTGSDFIDEYNKILVVNPEEAKHLESVLIEYYSELLRLYSSELEKENALLFILGFSMEDRHIRKITLRAAKSNPTLRIFICCSQNSEVAMRVKMETEKNPNIHIYTPDSVGAKYTLDYFTDNILKKVIENVDK